MDIFRFIAIGFVLLTIPSCAPSTGVTRIIHPAVVSRQTSLDNILVTTTSSLSEVDREKQSLNDQVISGLKETGWFASVGGNNSEINLGDGIKVISDIKEIEKVSDNARAWSGALAGQARILVRVKISDLKTGNEIGIFEVEGKSGKSANAGTTDEAVQRAAEQVVAEIKRINAQTAGDFAGKQAP